MAKVLIHTDGSCIGNPGPGDWGAILQKDGKSAKTRDMCRLAKAHNLPLRVVQI